MTKTLDDEVAVLRRRLDEALAERDEVHAQKDAIADVLEVINGSSVDFDPQPRSPQTQALKAILERLEPQKSQPIPDTASNRVSLPRS